MSQLHPVETAEYWLREARYERAFAEEDRRRQYGSVESIQIHLQQADEYERRAAAITKAIGSTQ